MFIRSSTHRELIREKDKQIRELLSLVESQSERLLVVAGYRPLLPQRGPMPAARREREPDPYVELDLVES